ncbi:MAG: hypothetical protein L0G06_03925 [Enterobacterales bacterium]|nr:hypothetical protein [Enterobacterales bacterium]
MDDEKLIRLTFTPEHHDGNEFLNGAVSLEDLRDRGFSVDRQSVTTIETVSQRISAQTERKPEKRQDVLFSELECGALRSEIDEVSGVPIFSVDATPAPNNDGHASIKSYQALGNGGLRKIRTILIAHMNKLVRLEDIGFPSANDPTS